MLHRFYVPSALAPGAHIALEGEELHHAVRVVRLRSGESVELFDGRGAAVRGVVEELGRDLAVIRVEEPVPARESRTPIVLAMAIINLDKFEIVLQKATELGVRAIIPLETERCEVRAERYRSKGERWSKIVFEAVKQCGRAVIPVVEAPLPFADAVGRAGTKLFFDADADHASGSEAAPITLFIGPEGGWSDAELTLARDRECIFQRLGPRRLRAETAAIVAAAIVAARHDDI
jgi:16S rRNA (uracil1498-N3)-methyltransferase